MIFLVFRGLGNDLSMKLEDFSLGLQKTGVVIKEIFNYAIVNNYDDAVADNIDKLIENNRL